MDNKQNQRDEIHKAIWNIANELRGNVDGWEFKSYVLTILFYRYISENLVNCVNEIEWENDHEDFRYENWMDKDITEEQKRKIVEIKGFFIYPSQLFQNVLKNGRGNQNLNIELKKIFNDIENSSTGTKSENTFKGLFSDFDVNMNKLGGNAIDISKKLYEVLNKIGGIKLSEQFEDNTIDTFGDAYEFLMGMYSSTAGKSGGEFFTPQEVSELLMKISISHHCEQLLVYDPTCGSGSLLLQAIKLAGEKRINKLFGQEVNPTTYNLCRMNMLLHNVNFDKFSIMYGNTLTDPKFKQQKFNVIVSNPPYSIKWNGEDDPNLANDERFTPAGALAPKSKADLAFVMHSLSYLSENGTAAIVCFPGVMYRGGKEGKIREYLIQNNFVDAIIQLPENLFFGTNIATSILVLNKKKRDQKILFIDASEQFIKVGKKNKLSEENINWIFNQYLDRKDTDFTKLVPNEEINDSSLYVSNYVQKPEVEEEIDIEKLNAELKEIVAEENRLREEIDKIIANFEKEFGKNLEEGKENQGN